MEVHLLSNLKNINPNRQKSYEILYRDYLQNMLHVVLHNRPTLSIATELKVYLIQSKQLPWGAAEESCLAGSRSPGFRPGPRGRAALAFFLGPPFLFSWGDIFFRPSTPTP